MNIEITGAPALALGHIRSKVANKHGGKALWNQVIMYLIKQDEMVKSLEIKIRNRDEIIENLKREKMELLREHKEDLKDALTKSLERPMTPMMVGMQQRMDLPYETPPKTLSRPPPPPPGTRIDTKSSGNVIRDLSTELKDAVKFGSPSRIVEALYGEKYERPPEKNVEAILHEHPDPNFYKVVESKEPTKQGMEYEEIQKILGKDIVDEEE